MDELQQSLKQLSFLLYNSLGIVSRDAPKVDPSAGAQQNGLNSDEMIDNFVDLIASEKKKIESLLEEMKCKNDENTNEKEFAIDGFFVEVEKLKKEEIFVNEELKRKIREFQEHSEKLKQIIF